MHLQSIVAPTTSFVAETGRKRLRLNEIGARQQQLMAEAPSVLRRRSWRAIRDEFRNWVMTAA